jgi:glyoxylase-like metal-dependent hydrolase (beta-lactamase superfamily II)
MMKWKVGDVTISRHVELVAPLEGGGAESILPDAYPDAVAAVDWLKPHFVTDDNQLLLSIHALLLEVGDQRLIVDTCVGNDKQRTNEFFHEMQSPFLEELQAAGWPRDSVDTVMCTHLHVDHVGWNTILEDGKWVPTFPNANYLIGRTELEHWQATGDPLGDGPILADSVQPVFDAGLATLVETNHVVSPEIRLRPTTGHTPGHVSVVIESRGEKALISGDCMHHPCQMAHPHWASSFDSDQDEGIATRRSLLAELADEPVLLIGTHFAGPTAGHVVKDGDAYRLDV